MSLERVSIAFIFDALTNVKIFMDDKVVSENIEPRHEREGEQIIP